MALSHQIELVVEEVESMNPKEIPDLTRYLYALYEDMAPSQYSDPPNAKEVQPDEKLLGSMTSEMKKLLMTMFAIMDEWTLRIGTWHDLFGESLDRAPAQVRDSIAHEEELFASIIQNLQDRFVIAVRIKYATNADDQIIVVSGGRVAIIQGETARLSTSKPLH